MKKLLAVAFGIAAYSTAALACHDRDTTAAQKKEMKAPVAAKKAPAKSSKQQKKS